LRGDLAESLGVNAKSIFEPSGMAEKTTMNVAVLDAGCGRTNENTAKAVMV
jgi:hypothetical protein